MKLLQTGGLAAVVALSLVGCGASSDPPADGASSDPPGGYGPLAVVDRDDEDRFEGGTQGTLRITDTCVYLERDDIEHDTLLVWRSSDVEWAASTRTITFSGPAPLTGDEPLELRDGNFIGVGGEPVIVEEDAERPPSDDSWMDGQKWLNRPKPGCDGDPFLVGSARTDPIN